MAIREKCLYCGQPVSASGYCTACHMNQPFMRKALNTSAYHYNIGLERAKARDLSGALESLKASLRYNKMNIKSRNLLGLVLYEMGEVVPAISQWVMSVNYQAEKNPAVRYLKELRDDPKELEKVSETARQFNQALEHAKQHSFDLAVIPLKKSISLNMNFVKGHLLMALIYIEKGRKGMAKKHLSRVLFIDRTNVTAQRILREMGEKEEAITRLAEQGEDAAEDLFSYYGVETPEGQRPAKKIEAKRTVGKRTSLKVNRFKEVSRARFSNIYMLGGIVIGILLLIFLMLPGIQRSAKNDANANENSYLKELAARNAEIAGLELSVEESQRKVEQVEREKGSLESTIKSQDAQIAALRSQLAEGGTLLLPDDPEPKPGENSSEEDPQNGENNGEDTTESGDNMAERIDGENGEGGEGTKQSGIKVSEIEYMIDQE